LPSGSIIFVIVALWAAVLVPALLRRHDEATENKSVDRFTRAMRTLRRDDPLPGDDHTVLMPRRPADAVAPQLFSKSDGPVAVAARLRRRGRAVSARAVSARVAAPAPAAPTRPVPSTRAGVSRPGTPAPRPAARRPVSSSLIARRRRTVRTIGIAAMVTLVGGLVFGGLVWALHGLVDGLAVVYLAHLRSEAKRARAIARRRPARPRVAEPAGRRTERYAAERVVGQPVGVRQEAGEAQQRHVSFEDAAEPTGAVASDPARGDAGEASRAWQPIPVPPPTYVTAPKAPRRGKQIDVPPSWVDGLRDDGAEVDLTALERPEPEIERLLERRRAVND
jgi:hypothetical protein